MKEYTIEQLKALAYDRIVQVQKLNSELQMIEQEVLKRSEKQPKSEPKPKKK